MRSTDEEMDHLASCLLIDSKGVSQLAEDTFKRMRRELMALRKVAEAAIAVDRAGELETSPHDVDRALSAALKEAGCDA